MSNTCAICILTASLTAILYLVTNQPIIYNTDMLFLLSNTKRFNDITNLAIVKGFMHDSMQMLTNCRV